MSNEYIFFTDQTALTFRICLVKRLGFGEHSLLTKKGVSTLSSQKGYRRLAAQPRCPAPNGVATQR